MMRCQLKLAFKWTRKRLLSQNWRTGELVDVALDTCYAQDFDHDFDIHSIDVDDVAPPTVNLSDANVMHHCCLVSYLKTLYIMMLIKLLVLKI